MAELHIDPQIMIWVMLPITFVMLMSGLIVYFFQQGNKNAPHASLVSIQHHSVVMLSDAFLANHQLLTPHMFFVYKSHLLNSVEFGVHPDSGDFRTKAFADEDVPPIDPTSMINSLIDQAGQFLPNMLQFAWVSYFFTGIIVAKFPFEAWIPDHFKVMFHHSLSPISKSLPTAHISSISWYIVNMLGLSSLRNLILSFIVGSNESSVDDLTAVAQQQVLGMHHDQLKSLSPITGGGVDFDDKLKAIRAKVDRLQYSGLSVLLKSQYRIVNEYAANHLINASSNTPHIKAD